MEVFPLESLTVAQAMALQFRLVDVMSQHFTGLESLSLGDLGVVSGYNQPTTTRKVEQVLADFFGAEEAILVRGSGTMALRLALHAMMRSGGKILVHEAPIYPTTESSFGMLKLELFLVDFNNLEAIKGAVKKHDFAGALIQVTRQQPTDRYDLAEVIATIRRAKADLPILTDDNYAVMKTRAIGTQCGANLSTFSTFKLLGPAGVGCVVGEAQFIQRIRQENYSGGLQVQGFEAMEVLRGMVYAPVALAISAQVVVEVRDRLLAGEVAGIKDAFVINAQSKVLMVELAQPIAPAVIDQAMLLGAAPHPVGAESRYEIVPMFYRPSSTFRSYHPEALSTMIRINPMRSGADTILRILSQAILNVRGGA
ncbi:aminotransferase class V-fold PLP-dependent enzyme [Entomospira culicis]|uniref:Aminotransferase n=1 Tax=Entomospira culicis TaxID=2719989 RepID=A0A968GI76_9SPIO|nr:aminotransferase class V-fold PLP-dependent enzyme [Entomospira culicis]NIZ19583.1 aminotransferase [Entomospira culicis]NIZ69512.1 aminotransferase [Entomospira culicis]WDI36627.1 aminotransferase class V-fold PLP-dependent enzyme [Entomospira culicis]WDI38255.1 aminotransferase class V-fold PLP-dependent enzyme [Entomospira culicis]